MPRLSDAYRDGQFAIEAPEGNDDELEAILVRLYQRGLARHPELAISETAFARHLARCGAPVLQLQDATSAEDLFLACGAIAGDPGAVAKLRREYWPVIVGYLRHLRAANVSIDDIEQSLWGAVLVGDEGRPPKLASYSGSGSLAGFIGVTAQRLALRTLGREEAEARAAALAAAEASALAAGMEADFAKQRYAADFERAVRAGLEVLDDRQRMILRMRTVHGLTVDRIARVYGVSQSTVSRWFDKARATVLEEARRALRKTVVLTDSDFDWLAGLMASQLDLSVSEILASA